MQKKTSRIAPWCFLSNWLFLEGVKVLNNVAYGNEFVHFLFLDINSEFLFAAENKLSKLDGVDSKVARKLSVESDLGLVNLKFVDKQFFELLKHNESLQISIAEVSAK